MTFGERLIELRKENGFNTRNEFAEKLGIPSTTLRNYEKNEREPGHTFLKQISELFNVSVDYLLCLTDEKEILKTFRLRISEQDLVKKYRTLDSSGQEHVNAVLDWETARVQQLTGLRSRLAAIVEFPQDSASDLVLNAAHEDETSTPEERRAGDSIMMDDSEWE